MELQEESLISRERKMAESGAPEESLRSRERKMAESGAPGGELEI